jgi:hypothetical protein
MEQSALRIIGWGMTDVDEWKEGSPVNEIEFSG